MRVADIFEEKNISNYSLALMSTESHKNCVSLAKNMNVTYDSLYEQFKNPVSEKEMSKKDILQIAQEQFGVKRIHLLFDDSRISKAKGQLKKIFRLRRNEHIRMIQGIFLTENHCVFMS